MGPYLPPPCHQPPRDNCFNLEALQKYSNSRLGNWLRSHSLSPKHSSWSYSVLILTASGGIVAAHHRAVEHRGEVWLISRAGASSSQQPGYIWLYDVSATSASAWLGIRHPQLQPQFCFMPLTGASSVCWYSLNQLSILRNLPYHFSHLWSCHMLHQKKAEPPVQWYGGISQLISLILGTVIDKIMAAW